MSELALVPSESARSVSSSVFRNQNEAVLAAQENDERLMAGILEEVDDSGEGALGRRFVLTNKHPFRLMWDFLFAILICYIATVFLYRLTFITLHVPNSLEEESPFFDGLNLFVDIYFWADLAINFFFSYETDAGHEVTNLKKIATNYLCGFFALNLIACLPPSLVEEIIDLSIDTSVPVHNNTSPSEGLNRIVRITRLQRVSKIARLVRLGRLAKVTTLRGRFTKAITAHSRLTNYLLNLPCVRVVNVISGLLWTIHLLACGWYLCAAMHEDYNECWLARRAVNAAGDEPLLFETPFVQWLHSYYFVLTVFTTVGFGDMYAVTTGEIMYVAFCMFVGAVVHSIVISEVINVVTHVDLADANVRAHTGLVEAFCCHTELDNRSRQFLKEWVTVSGRSWARAAYDAEEMRTLVTKRNMPAWLLNSLPQNLFQGKLLDNRMFRVIAGQSGAQIPPRLPVLLALTASVQDFHHNTVVYKRYDKPVALFLVLSGTFALVGKPEPRGGQEDPVNREFSNVFATKNRKKASSSSMSSTVAMRDGKEHEDVEQRQHTLVKSLSPYCLFSMDTYFGEIELLLGEPQRTSTVRVESHQASALYIPTQDYLDILEGFPVAQKALRSAAAHAKLVRARACKRLTNVQNHRTLAARIIQRGWKHCHKSRTERLKELRAEMPAVLRRAGSLDARLRATTSRGSGALTSFGSFDAQPHPHMQQLSTEVRDLRSAVNKLESGMGEFRETIIEELRSALDGFQRHIETVTL